MVKRGVKEVVAPTKLLNRVNVSNVVIIIKSLLENLIKGSAQEGLNEKYALL